MKLKNQIRIIGRLTANPQIKKLSNKKKIARLKVIVNQMKKHGGEFTKKIKCYNVSVCGENVKYVEENLKQNCEILIIGRMLASDLNSKPKKLDEIIAESIIYRNIKQKVEKIEIISKY